MAKHLRKRFLIAVLCGSIGTILLYCLLNTGTFSKPLFYCRYLHLRSKEGWSSYPLLQPGAISRYGLEEDQLWFEQPVLRANQRLFHTRALLEEPSVCEGRFSVLVLVPSQLDNVAQRDSIRDTWARRHLFTHNATVRVVFLLASPKDPAMQVAIHREFLQHRDILQGDFVDTYRNQSVRMVMGLRWALVHCWDKVDFIMKMDDDVFVNMFQLLHYLKQTPARRWSFHCRVRYRSPVLRTPDSCRKWCVTYQEYPGKAYPKFCNGPSYVFTPDLLPYLVHGAHITPFFWIEDVFITGIVPVLLPSRVSHVDTSTMYTNGWYIRKAYLQCLADMTSLTFAHSMRSLPNAALLQRQLWAVALQTAPQDIQSVINLQTMRPVAQHIVNMTGCQPKQP